MLIQQDCAGLFWMGQGEPYFICSPVAQDSYSLPAYFKVPGSFKIYTDPSSQHSALLPAQQRPQL